MVMTGGHLQAGEPSDPDVQELPRMWSCTTDPARRAGRKSSIPRSSTASTRWSASRRPASAAPTCISQRRLMPMAIARENSSASSSGRDRATLMTKMEIVSTAATRTRSFENPRQPGLECGLGLAFGQPDSDLAERGRRAGGHHDRAAGALVLSDRYRSKNMASRAARPTQGVGACEACVLLWTGAEGSPLLHGDVCGVDYCRDVPSARDLAPRPALAALVGFAPDPYAGRGLESRSSWAVRPVHARAAVGNLRPDRNDDPPELSGW
jgi:hypothetical protein